MARRSGVLLIGQDQVLAAPRRDLFVLTAADCSRNVLRKLDGAGGVFHRTLEGVDREELGRSLGLSGVQIAALPLKSGFAKKLAELLQQEGLGIDE
jgi:hypothetical protein